MIKFSRKIITLENLFNEYSINNKYLRKKSIKQMLNTIKVNIPEFWFSSIKEIKEKELKNIIKIMEDSGKKKESIKLLAYLQILFNYAENNDSGLE